MTGGGTGTVLNWTRTMVRLGSNLTKESWGDKACWLWVGVAPNQVASYLVKDTHSPPASRLCRIGTCEGCDIQRPPRCNGQHGQSEAQAGAWHSLALRQHLSQTESRAPNLLQGSKKKISEQQGFRKNSCLRARPFLLREK